MLHLEEPRLAGPQAIVKRGFDLTISILLLIVLSPVLLITAAAIAMTSRGPVSFIQERVGKAGRIPPGEVPQHDRRCREHAQERSSASGHTPDRYVADPRSHHWAVSAALVDRRTAAAVQCDRRTDVPVGPRPMLVTELPLLGDSDHRRHITMPGMTGLWQVAGRKEVAWDERMQMDLRYVENWSLALDLVIMVKTVKAVATGRGAH